METNNQTMTPTAVTEAPVQQAPEAVNPAPETQKAEEPKAPAPVRALIREVRLVTNERGGSAEFEIEFLGVRPVDTTNADDETYAALGPDYPQISFDFVSRTMEVAGTRLLRGAVEVALYNENEYLDDAAPATPAQPAEQAVADAPVTPATAEGEAAAASESVAQPATVPAAPAAPLPKVRTAYEKFMEVFEDSLTTIKGGKTSWWRNRAVADEIKALLAGKFVRFQKKDGKNVREVLDLKSSRSFMRYFAVDAAAAAECACEGHAFRVHVPMAALIRANGRVDGDNLQRTGTKRGSDEERLVMIGLCVEFEDIGGGRSIAFPRHLLVIRPPVFVQRGEDRVVTEPGWVLLVQDFMSLHFEQHYRSLMARIGPRVVEHMRELCDFEQKIRGFTAADSALLAESMNKTEAAVQLEVRGRGNKIVPDLYEETPPVPITEV